MTQKSINMVIIKGPINETFDVHYETKILYGKIKKILSNKDDKFRIINAQKERLIYYNNCIIDLRAKEQYIYSREF